MLETIAQLAIFGFGISSIVLVARKNKWGFVFGLLTQPFWIYTAFINEQWGIFFVSFAYAASWSYGVYQWFYKEKIK
ncbi:nicotinamide mononucleotide transporter [Candidatus Berkelbacteria bacterium]|nr:nicotinamide mononucleotide transporter [Candidatus Berkelbacteria bacterium]